MNTEPLRLNADTAGDPSAAGDLLPLVYDELRQLAAHRMAQESPGHSLEATALVHEAYLRLVGSGKGQHWDSRGHFFAAAAEAMRRILVESARRKKRVKHGGGRTSQAMDETAIPGPMTDDDLLALDESLDRLTQADPVAADLVKLRYFGGVKVEEAATMLGMSERSAYYTWQFARSWLHRDMRGE